jgi:hypothetical protein
MRWISRRGGAATLCMRAHLKSPLPTLRSPEVATTADPRAEVLRHVLCIAGAEVEAKENGRKDGDPERRRGRGLRGGGRDGPPCVTSTASSPPRGMEQPLEVHVFSSPMQTLCTMQTHNGS